MTPFQTLPLNSLAPFSEDGRVFRSFGRLILARQGSVLLVPVALVQGDLTRVIDGCPVPWEEVADVLDAPPLPKAGIPDLVPALQGVFPSGWRGERFALGPDGLIGSRFVHEVSGVRYGFCRRAVRNLD